MRVIQFILAVAQAIAGGILAKSLPKFYGLIQMRSVGLIYIMANRLKGLPLRQV